MASGSGSKKAPAPRTQSEIARATWELSNNLMEVSASEDIYKYDREQQRSMLSAKPWEKDPHFFKEIKISALALLKMVMHMRLLVPLMMRLHMMRRLRLQLCRRRSPLLRLWR